MAGGRAGCGDTCLSVPFSPLPPPEALLGGQSVCECFGIKHFWVSLVEGEAELDEVWLDPFHCV